MSRRALVVLIPVLAALLLVACQNRPPAAPAGPAATLIATPVATLSPAATGGRPLPPELEATLIPLATPLPPVPTVAPTPTVPTAELVDQLLPALVFEEADGGTAYRRQRLDNWEMGFRAANYCQDGPYRWLDGEHLMLFPVTGRTLAFDEPIGEETLPAVVSLSNTILWLAGERTSGCHLPRWSAALQRVIEVGENEVRMRDLEGNVSNSFAANGALHLAPSGRRLLAGNQWIDLESGEIVELIGWAPNFFHPPAWTADERRLFACCFQYANATTGEAWTRDSLPGFFLGGRGSWPGEEIFSESHWVAGETRTMITSSAVFPMAEGHSGAVVPLIDPVAQSYQDIAVTLDAPEVPIGCGSVAPGGQHFWLGCSSSAGNRYYQPSFLVELSSLTAIEITGRLLFHGWSADGRFLIASEPASTGESGGGTWLIATNGEQQRVADQPAAAAHWHGREPVVALRSGRLLQFVHAETGAVRTLHLQQAITGVLWQPADTGVALLTEDGRLWWLAEPFNAEAMPVPITPPLTDVHSVRWSPDGTRLAFASENSLNVIKVGD